MSLERANLALAAEAVSALEDEGRYSQKHDVEELQAHRRPHSIHVSAPDTIRFRLLGGRAKLQRAPREVLLAKNGRRHNSADSTPDNDAGRKHGALRVGGDVIRVLHPCGQSVNVVREESMTHIGKDSRYAACRTCVYEK